MDWGAELGLAAGSRATNAPPAPETQFGNLGSPDTNALYDVVQQRNHDAFSDFGVTPRVGKELVMMRERGDPQLAARTARILEERKAATIKLSKATPLNFFGEPLCMDKWGFQARQAVLASARRDADGLYKAAHQVMAEDPIMGPKVEAHDKRYGPPESQHQHQQFVNRVVCGKDGFTCADHLRMLKWGMPPEIYESERVAGSVKDERYKKWTTFTAEITMDPMGLPVRKYPPPPYLDSEPGIRKACKLGDLAPPPTGTPARNNVQAAGAIEESTPEVSRKRERETATADESGATPPPALLREETQEEAEAAPEEA